MTKTPAYAELHCHSNYSFLDGASSPELLVATAAEFGLSALAITDHDGFYGAARFAEAASDVGLKTVFGAELNLGLTAPRTDTPDPAGEHLLVLAKNPDGYRRLSALLTTAHMRGGQKGLPQYDVAELAEAAQCGDWQILTGCRKGAVRRALDTGGIDAAEVALCALVESFGLGNVAIELSFHGRPTDTAVNDALTDLAEKHKLPTVASTNAHYAIPEQARLATAVAAIRTRSSLVEMDGWLPAAGTAYLRSPAEMAYLFRRWPGAVERASELGQTCAFELQLVAPELPRFPVPAGHTLDSWLRAETYAGARERYGPPEVEKVPGAYKQLDRELAIIRKLGFAGYFLIVHHIVGYCREKHILCQGRGSAANSAVCFALGITQVDAVAYDLLFERFLSPERDGYPDIDLDIESGRREDVIQFVYDHYGRAHAALVANVIAYRPKLAVRDAARTLGYSPGQADAWSKHLDRWSGVVTAPEVPEQVLELANQLVGAPRHLGIHPGGMVLADRPVAEVVPVEWARMEKRSILQWDKDDCAYAGLVKFDLLGLGMLSALRYATDLIRDFHGVEVDLAALDKSDPAVYDLLCRADSVGLFQVESRAQMQTLPRMQPRTFHDLAIEVALIRPGPIQGGSVNPYLKRRKELARGVQPPPIHPALQKALGKTLGVPLFQEQMMQMVIDGAGFSAAEADQLRRAMGSKRSAARMATLRDRLYIGLEAAGITGSTADEVWAGLEGFAAFGFPESHAISFAFIVYSSAWLKTYYPAAFFAGLLNAQPMGFYSKNSLIADARRHQILCLRPDINASAIRASLEHRADSANKAAIRLGLGEIRGISEGLAERIITERTAHGPYRSSADLAGRVQLVVGQLENLATAGALECFELERRQAIWQAGGVASYASPEMLPGLASHIDAPRLPSLSPAQELLSDLWATGISPDSHPLSHLRAHLDRDVLPITGLAALVDATRVRVAGVITHRQRPETAGGVTFLNLEDETGMLNVVCTKGFWTRYRSTVRTAGAAIVRGQLQKGEGTINLLADHIQALPTPDAVRSRDFR